MKSAVRDSATFVLAAKVRSTSSWSFPRVDSRFPFTTPLQNRKRSTCSGMSPISSMLTASFRRESVVALVESVMRKAPPTLGPLDSKLHGRAVHSLSALALLLGGPRSDGYTPRPKLKRGGRQGWAARCTARYAGEACGPRAAAPTVAASPVTCATAPRSVTLSTSRKRAHSRPPISSQRSRASALRSSATSSPASDARARAGAGARRVRADRRALSR